MAQEQPTPVVQGELWKRCVKVTYLGGYKPSTESQLALDVEGAGGAPFVNAKLKKKSAVLLFSCTADAEDLVHGVGTRATSSRRPSCRRLARRRR